MASNYEKNFYFNLLKEMVNKEIDKDSKSLSYQDILRKNEVKIIDLHYIESKGIWKEIF